jgi:SAM-dependent methyltransferase
MGAGQIQGKLWGTRARDYAGIVEGAFRPLYEAVFDEAGVGVEIRLLDVGCGPGLAAQLAAQRGAQVSGLDAAEASLAIARVRTPEGDFRAGEIENLPWPDDTFDVVTGFNAFSFASDLVNALQEARRVAKPGGRVAMAFWADDKELDLMHTMTALWKLLPPSLPEGEAEVPISAPGRGEMLLEQAGLTPLARGEVECIFEYPDLDTAVRAIMSAGPTVAVAEQVGDEVVQKAIAKSFSSFRTSSGGYRQRNKLYYLIAAV